MAAKLGIEPDDGAFKNALRDLVAEGVLVAQGATRDRRYVNLSINGGAVFADRNKAAGVSPREAAGLTTPEGWTDGSKFAPLAARAGRGGRIIGARVKEKA